MVFLAPPAATGGLEEQEGADCVAKGAFGVTREEIVEIGDRKGVHIGNAGVRRRGRARIPFFRRHLSPDDAGGKRFERFVSQ